MVETLLIIMIILLVIVLVMVGYLIFFKKSNTQTSDTTAIKDAISQGRIDTLYDLRQHVDAQNKAIQEFKDIVAENISKFEKTNQQELIAFLNQTSTKLTALENQFTIKSDDVNSKNKEQVSELILKTNKDLQELKTHIIKEINETNSKNNARVNENNLKTQDHINAQITLLKEQVQKSLESGFEKNEKAMHHFIEKMALLEASTRQMEGLQKEINRFSTILNDQKSRGNFGEGVLEQIFYNIFGDDRDHMFYQRQVNLTKAYGAKEITTSKGKIAPTVDFIYYIHTEHEKLPLSIDAKFPYTNYTKLLEDDISESEKTEVTKLFKSNVKDRIREVSKYIIEGITAPYAIMFIPAEAVFIDIYKNYPDLVEEARIKRVVLASPSLIITIIQMMQVILKDYRKRNNADKILLLIDSIGDEFNRFVIRFDKHKERIKQLQVSVDELDITNEKIVKKLDEVKSISSAQNLLIEEEIESL